MGPRCESIRDARIDTLLDWFPPDPRHRYLLRFVFDTDGSGDVSSGDFLSFPRQIESAKGRKHYSYVLNEVRNESDIALRGAVSSEEPSDLAGATVPATVTLFKIQGEGRSVATEAVLTLEVNSMPFEFEFEGTSLERFGEYYLQAFVDMDNSGDESPGDLVTDGPSYLNFVEDRSNVLLEVVAKQ